MSNVLRIAVVDPDDGSRGMLKAMLLGMDTIWLEAECSRYEFFADVVGQTTPDLGIVSIDDDPHKSLELVAELTATHPDCMIFVASSSNDGNLILKAMRAGAKEFLPLPLQLEDMLNALGRIRDRQFGGTGGGSTGKRSSGCEVTAVVGVAGGVGTTTLAVNTAAQWTTDPENTVSLIDLDMYLGDIDIFLDIIPDYTIVDVAQNVARLDFALLKRSLVKHSSGLYLLPRPLELDEVPVVTPENLGRVIGLLKATFSHMVIDLSKSFNPIDIAAMQAATTILLVTQLDLSCLRNTVRMLSWFRQHEGLHGKIKVVVNRVGCHNNQITVRKAQETIGEEIFWQIPNEVRAAEDARGAGQPLHDVAPRSGISQAVSAMANTIIGFEPSESEEPGEKRSLGRSFFNRLLANKEKK